MGYVNKTYLSTQFKNFADKIAKVFSKIGHTHLKSDITDFPTSMPANGGNAATVGGHTVGVNVPSNAKFTDTTYSKLSEFTDDVGYVKNTDARLTDARNAKDVYAWAKASSKPSYTKAEVGLGNVDNTADANKRVDHANTAQWASQLGHDLIFSICDGNGNVVSKKNFNGTTSTKIVVAQGGHTHSQYLTSDYDTKNCTTTFESGDSTTGDSTAPAIITSGETHKSLFNKLSTAVKNVRWLLSKMGTTDISAIGNGTVTGALSTLNSNIGWVKDFSYSQIVANNSFQRDSGKRNINSQTNMIRVLFWYSGTIDPQAGYLNFYKNMPGKNIQILHYYDGTYNAKVTVEVDWKNNTYVVFSIILPNEYWYVAVQEWM